ncbi:hypothetical protein F4781DRAFT_405612 [Annulohypoxylon bovei var. microspora]|nr:hypothetical protein F4781DRAFT_405612 [Annulohypoxylon bovei var. microspora]
MQLKPRPKFIPAPNKERREGLKQFVEIYHPGYEQPTALVSLGAHDTHGLFYGIAYYTCCIITGNTWTEDEGTTGPHFSKPNPTDDSISSYERFKPVNDILPPGRYFFHVPAHTGETPYPIIPNFQEWQFPSRLPKPWRGLQVQPPTSSRNNVHSPCDSPMAPCCMTAHLSSLQTSHVMPPATQGWLKSNNMRKYLKDVKVKKTHLARGNMIYLRGDVHFLWDQNNIVIVPKPDSSNMGKYCFVTHVLNAPDKSEDANMEVFQLYHNVPCLDIPRVPVEFLFARFAWSIFTNLVIMLFNDDDGDELYSVSLRDGKHERCTKMVQVKDLPKLSTKATGIRGTSTPVGEKRKFGEMERIYSLRTGQMEPVEQKRLYSEIDQFYSMRTGQMESIEDEDRDWECSDYFSDEESDSDSEPPGKRSRSCSSDEKDDSNDDARYVELSTRNNVNHAASYVHLSTRDNRPYDVHHDTILELSSSATSSGCSDLWPPNGLRPFSSTSGNATKYPDPSKPGSNGHTR